MSRLKNVLHWILCKRGLRLYDLAALLGTNTTYVYSWLKNPTWRVHRYTTAFEVAVKWDFDKIMAKYENILDFAEREPRGYLAVVSGYWEAIRENPISIAGTTYIYLVEQKMTMGEFSKKSGIHESTLSALLSAKKAMTPLIYERLCRVSSVFEKHPPIGIRCSNTEHVSLLQLAVHRRWISKVGLRRRVQEFKRKAGHKAMDELVLTYRNTAQQLIRDLRFQHTGSEENFPSDFEVLSLKLQDALRASSKTKLDEATR